jgi:hypothetical protein
MELIQQQASELDYNRQLREDIADKLDPEGMSLIVPAMVHSHANFEEVDAHMRAFAYLKVRGSDSPVRAIIDIPMNIFDSLPETTITLPNDPRNG